MPPGSSERRSFLQKYLNTDTTKADKRKLSIRRAQDAVEAAGGRVDGPDIIDQAVYGFINGAGAGLPKTINDSLGYTMREPDGKTEKFARSAGDIVGWILGIPGIVTKGVIGTVPKLVPALKVAGVEPRLVAGVKRTVAEMFGLSAGF